MRAALPGVMLSLMLVTSTAASASDVVVAVSDQREIAVVAAGQEVRIFSLLSGKELWRTSGVRSPRELTVSEDDQVAVAIDPLHNELAIIDLERRSSQIQKVCSGPAGAIFDKGALYVLCRGARTIQLYQGGRLGAEAEVGRDARQLFRSGEKVYVYSRVDGILQAFDRHTLDAGRSLAVDPFASAVKADGAFAYLVIPSRGRIATIDLTRFVLHDQFDLGGVPTDLSIRDVRTLISAGNIDVADPSSRKVWQTERSQRMGSAFARGFIRGLTGLGLAKGGSAAFPAPVDRIQTVRDSILAYDSYARKLYLKHGKAAPRAIDGKFGPREFALTGEGRIVLWNDARDGIEFHIPRR